MDELFVDAGNQYEMYSQDVGYISGMSSPSRGHLSLTVQGRRDRCVLPIPPLRVLSTTCQVFRAFARYGLPSKLPRPICLQANPQEMIMFLQCLPTQTWTDHDIELLLSESYVLKTVWQGAENHFANQKPNGGGFGMLGR